MLSLVFVIAAYLLGSISFAVVMSKLFALPDPRTYGSGNPGATNVLRSGKKLAAALTLLGDAAKGWLAVFLAIHFSPPDVQYTTLVAAVALAVFIGHLFPIFLRLKGGKGVETALGGLLALNVLVGMTALSYLVAMVLLSPRTSLSSLMASAWKRS